MEPAGPDTATRGLEAFRVAGEEGERRPNRERSEANLKAKDEQAKQLREPHQQALSMPAPKPDFQGTQFIARFLDCAVTRSGEVVIRLRVPKQYRDEALALASAAEIPLSVDIRRWSFNGTTRGPEGAGEPGHDTEGG